VLNLFQYQYSTQLVFLLSISILLLLIFNRLLIKKTFSSQKKETKQKFNNNENHTDYTDARLQKEEKNPYIDLIKEIDSALSISKNVEYKFRKIANDIQLLAGLFYAVDKDILKLESTYAFEKEAKAGNIKIGEGLIGQVAKDGQSIQIDIKDQIDLKIKSGLGESKPNYLYLLPVKKEGEIKGVVELAVFIKLSNNKLNFLKELFEK
jgi:putative methionine-R-sulfoxide reductase with GAF domain